MRPRSPAHEPPDPRRWRALVLLGAAQFMLILDVTVVAVALPDIGAGLALGRTQLTWVVTAYTLMFGGLMLLGGRAADLFGARRLVLAGLAVFTAASLTAGLAGGAAVLIGARMLQGVGAALLSPAALSVVATTFHGPERNRALGVWAAIGGTGSAVGVLVGGLLTAGPGWEWIFYVNVPIGLALLALLPGALPVTARATHRGALDVPGALLVTSATAAAIYGLTRAGDDGWSAPATLVPLAAGLALYAAFGLLQHRSPAPLMRLASLARRPVLTGAFLMLVATALLISSFFLGSFYFQGPGGHGPLATGALFLPVAVGTVVGAHLAGHAVGRVGPRLVAVPALLTAAGGLAIPAAEAGTLSLAVGLSVAAAGLGAGFVAATATALARVEPAEAGLTSGIVNTCHEFGGAIGVPVVSSIAGASIAAGGAATAEGFTDALTFTTLTAAAAAVAALFLVPAGRPPAEAAIAHLH
ncbi:MFS transporter [Streptomyces mayteni]